MKRIFALLLACGLLLPVAQQLAVTAATAQQGNQKQEQQADPADASQRALFSKIDAYVICLNALSPDIYGLRGSYFSWAPRSGPTGRERADALGTFNNPARCRDSVEMVNDVAPHHPQFEDAARAYVSVVTRLYPLVKEAHTYYRDGNYKDDNMDRGRALHPLLVAAFDDFFAADQKLRDLVEPVNDNRAQQNLAYLESRAGRNLSYERAALLVDAKTLVNALRGAPDMPRLTAALSQYETSLTTVSTLKEAARNNGGNALYSLALSDAGTLLSNAKVFMRRLRDKTPYDTGDRFLLRHFNSGAWMVEGSLPNLALSYNSMLDTTNRETTSPSLKWIPLDPADTRLKEAARK